jgi:hypothetical protein
MKALVLDEVKGYFRPELLNRFDEQIVFHKLGLREVRHADQGWAPFLCSPCVCVCDIRSKPRLHLDFISGCLSSAVSCSQTQISTMHHPMFSVGRWLYLLLLVS